MARYIREVQLSSAVDSVLAEVHRFLTSEGYEFREYGGEKVYKKGSGWVAPPSFFKVSVSGNLFRFETWMKYVVLPGVYVGELGVDGFIGCAAKGPWKERISRLETFLLSNGTAVAGPPVSKFSQPSFSSRPAAKAFCTACGTEVSAGTLFCTNCGHAVEEPVPEASGVDAVFSASAGGRISKKEWLKNYAPKYALNEVRNAAIVCYVLAGFSFLLSLFLNPLGILDALIFAGLALGMHLSRSKVWAILLCVFSGVEVLLGFLVSGTFSGWLLIIASVFGIVACVRLDKLYFQSQQGM